MGNKTSLYDEHVKAGAKIVDFAGWDMPLHYGSQIEEHHKVRDAAGVFDVSHMLVVDIIGADAKNFLQYVLANDVNRLQETGKALYTCMLNEQGGVIDDLITYSMGDGNYRIVVNAGRREQDIQWLTACSKAYKVKIQIRTDLAMLAVQGPTARGKAHAVFNFAQAAAAEKLQPFQGAMVDQWFIARTGYTGEDGFEIMLPHSDAKNLWTKLLTAEVAPIGLGARDTLRLEAGLNLYGSDMNEKTTPLETNLSWTVAWQPDTRKFIGRTALEQQKQAGVEYKLVGLVLQDRGVLRNHQKVIIVGVGEGEITSGSFSPTLGFAIALARVPIATKETCAVDIRGKLVTARVVKPPFVRQGKKLI